MKNVAKYNKIYKNFGFKDKLNLAHKVDCIVLQDKKYCLY